MYSFDSTKSMSTWEKVARQRGVHILSAKKKSASALISLCLSVDTEVV